MTPAQVIQQIKDIISLLVREGLSDHQRLPSSKQVGSRIQVGIPDSPDLSIALKNEPYTKIYDELRKAEAYHLRMVDGALIQMLYTFASGHLESHRLAMFPAPALETYDAVPEDYDAEAWFTDIVGEYSVKFPIRFDFSALDAEHINVDHPKSHLTLGQYKGCRIPVDAPLTPKRFMRFVLRNFYNPAYFAVDLDAAAQPQAFAQTITAEEQRILFVTG